jgi:hypothetical protein
MIYDYVYMLYVKGHLVDLLYIVIEDIRLVNQSPLV